MNFGTINRADLQQSSDQENSMDDWTIGRLDDWTIGRLDDWTIGRFGQFEPNVRIAYVRNFHVQALLDHKWFF